MLKVTFAVALCGLALMGALRASDVETKEVTLKIMGMT